MGTVLVGMQNATREVTQFIYLQESWNVKSEQVKKTSSYKPIIAVQFFQFKRDIS